MSRFYFGKGAKTRTRISRVEEWGGTVVTSRPAIWWPAAACKWGPPRRKGNGEGNVDDDDDDDGDEERVRREDAYTGTFPGNVINVSPRRSLMGPIAESVPGRIFRDATNRRFRPIQPLHVDDVQSREKKMQESN